MIKNKSGGRAIYKYEIIEGQDSLKTRSIEIEINRNQKEEIVMLGFGYLWTDKKIEEYFSTIKKIEIISCSDTVLFTDKKEMFDFFKERRRGIFKTAIKIKIY